MHDLHIHAPFCIQFLTNQLARPAWRWILIIIWLSCTTFISHSQFIATVRNQGCFSLVSATWGLNGVSLGCFSAGPWFPPLRMPISLLWVLLSYRQFLLNSLYFSSSCLSKWDEFFHVFVLKTVQQYNLHVVWGPPGFVWFFPSKRWTNGKSNMFEE